MKAKRTKLFIIFISLIFSMIFTSIEVNAASGYLAIGDLTIDARSTYVEKFQKELLG